VVDVSIAALATVCPSGNRCPTRPSGTSPTAGANDPILAFAQLDHEHPRRDQRSSTLGHKLENHPGVRLPASARLMHGGVESIDGALQFTATSLRSAVAVRMVDRQTSELRQLDDRLLVTGRERRTALLSVRYKLRCPGIGTATPTKVRIDGCLTGKP
jgi:hypothetical protein